VSSLWGFRPSAARDCSTCQFRAAELSELEFHNKSKIRGLRCGWNRLSAELEQPAFLPIDQKISKLFEKRPLKMLQHFISHDL